MSTLKALAQSAMLGARSGLTLPAFEQANLPSDPNAALLGAAALSGIQSIGGFVPAHLPADQPPCPPEDRPYLPQPAARLLKRILAGECEAALPEFLHLAAGRGLLAPPETLPGLLGLATSPLRPLALQIAGKRGRWLARHNPAWAYALESDPHDAWQHGTRSVRLAALEHTRSRDPALARQWLQAAWEQDSPDDRAIFVAALAAGLSMDDEPFLDACLDDQRKDVRMAARRLLLRMPDSRLVKRMWARAKPLLHLNTPFLSAEKLEAALPDDKPDAAARRDGVGDLTLPKRLGPQASLLAQMLALTPPAFWRSEFDKPPARLITAALHGESLPPIILGWQLAAQGARDIGWAEAIASAWLSNPTCRAALDEDSLPTSIQLLPPETIESLAAARIKPIIGELDDKNHLVDFLSHYQRPWTAKMARLVVQSARRLANGYNYHLSRALPGFAFYMPPELADEFAGGWPADPSPHCRESIAAFLAVLRFRQEIYQTLQP